MVPPDTITMLFLMLRPYMEVILASVLATIGVFMILQLVNKLDYRLRTMLLMLPLAGTYMLLATWFVRVAPVWVKFVFFTPSQRTLNSIRLGFRVSYGVIVITFLMAVLTLFFQGNLGRIILRLFRAKPLDEPEAYEFFASLRKVSEKAGVKLPETYLINSGVPLVSIVGNAGNAKLLVSVGLLESLSLDEVEACLGHEIAHIKDHDQRIRTVAMSMKIATAFSPFSHLLEPAICREREFLADKKGAELTGKPKQLASALIKLDEAYSINPMRGFLYRIMTGVFIATPFKQGVGMRIFCRHPSVEERVKRLLEEAYFTE